MVNHWRATRPQWALECDGVLMTAEFPLSCGTPVKLPRLFATRNKARSWCNQNSDLVRVTGKWQLEWKPVRVELGYRRITKENPF